MVFSISVLGSVAWASADLWQSLVCNTEERLSSDQVVDLLCCLPFYHLRRLAVCIFSFFCFPINPYPHPHFFSSLSYNPYHTQFQTRDD